MKIFNIAEKPSVAKSISNVLCKNLKITKGYHKYCPNIYFKYKFDEKEVEMIFTSVLGHLYASDFVNKQGWEEIQPERLFEEEIIKFVPEDFLKIKENLEKNSLKSDLIIIWTDCDREGENIGREIQQVINNVKKMPVKRARFSGISKYEVDRALNNLTLINDNEADAVDARIELDLRIGSSFTRLQTLEFKRQIPNITEKVISYGSCQIPTLGFVVERHREIESFFAEKFWSLKVEIRKENITNEFSWQRGNIFDKNCVIHFFNKLENKKGRISDKKEIPREKLKPLPLRTVEFQKTCSCYYKYSSHKVMEIAESLYNKGYISYPRTETDSFGSSFNFKGILKELCKDERLGRKSSELLEKHFAPRRGKNNDMAHLPIYPLKNGNSLCGDDRNIYEFIARRFLACLSENAKGLETEIKFEVENEIFNLKGLKILEKNYLEVYFYDKWENKPVSNFNLNEQHVIKEKGPSKLIFDEGETTKPEYLTEAELINLMDKNGIGTDATIHEHILKIQNRKYAIKEQNKILPLALGISLIDIYESLGLELSKPRLRSELEINLKKVCNGDLLKEELVNSEIVIYKGIFEILKINSNTFGEYFIQRKNVIEETRKYKKRSISNSKENISNGVEIYEVKKSIRNTEESKEVNIKCDCNKLVKESTVLKKNGNKGKVFYSCNSWPKGCDFFQWKDSNTKRIEQVMDNGIKCYCGFDSKMMVANTEKNKGKEFYKCKKAYKPCSFFKWKDED